MAKLLERELHNLASRLRELDDRVRASVTDVIRALEEGDTQVGRSVIAGDDAVDREEVELERACLDTIALYQPVAHDLRLIATILKINGELERINDLASDIAKGVIRLEQLRKVSISAAQAHGAAIAHDAPRQHAILLQAGRRASSSSMRSGRRSGSGRR